MSDSPDPQQKRQIAVDVQDIVAGTGALCTLIGAASIHWALALIVVGVSAMILAYRMR